MRSPAAEAGQREPKGAMNNSNLADFEGKGKIRPSDNLPSRRRVLGGLLRIGAPASAAAPILLRPELRQFARGLLGVLEVTR